MIKRISITLVSGVVLFLASHVLLLSAQPVKAETHPPVIFPQTTNSTTITDTARLSYTVQGGDIPLKIAARFDIPVEALLAANPGVEPTRLQIGQILEIPAQGEVTTVSGGGSFVYNIQAGDTLLALAGRYNVSLADILAANPGVEPTLLQIGQQITIPGAGSALDKAQAPGSQLVTGSEAFSKSSSLEQAVLAAVNSQRAQVNLPPYSASPALAQLARAHAEDMVERGYFSHITPEGITLRDRLAEANLSANWVGENIQRNTQPPERTVQTAINWFMSSSAHRNNLLHQRYTQVGVGVAEGPPGWFTYVLVFSE